MQILITGARGMLGQDVARVLRTAQHQVTETDLPEMDITDPLACAAAVAGCDWVVNTAAYTAVDNAEASEGIAFTVNAVGPAVLARAARAAGARMVHISTDYVFAGDASSPYAEDAPLSPRSAYGRTKSAGEWAVRAECPDSLIVRTAWLYGPGGPNFVTTMARLAGERDTLSVVDDQRGQPTTTIDLAQFIAALVAADVPAGVYHGTCEGETTWFGFTQAIFEELGWDPQRVQPTTSDAFVRPAPRPAYSVLGHDRTDAVGVRRLRHWREALAATVHEVVR
ncbi:MAG: dTDP-4-dehydrorhamnose reductase [Actinomycetales bacterium]|nr:dTDP-4-dehydrorhamnose reductase [Actinomycetales bacterium]